MTDLELLLQMKSILERMFLSEEKKYHEKLNIAYELVLKEISSPEPEIDRNILTIISSILQTIFHGHGLPPLPFGEPSND